MTPPPPQLLEFLFHYERSTQALALGLRAVVLGALAPCHEHLYAMRSKVVMLYASSPRVLADSICFVGVHRRHVTLSFARGTDLEDPGGLLQGTGKAMRHVKIHTASDVGRPEIRALLRQARALAGTAPRHGHAGDGVVTTVKPRSRAAWPDRPRVHR